MMRIPPEIKVKEARISTGEFCHESSLPAGNTREGYPLAELLRIILKNILPNNLGFLFLQ